jgi:5'(3')-deoxyribonucleotidase
MPKTANKPIIAVDVDDVISAQNESMRKFANRKYGYSHMPEDYLKIEAPYWGYWGYVWGVSDEEQNLMVKEFQFSGEITKQKVIPGSVAALKRLSKAHELVIVTSRHDVHFDETHEYLEKHFPALFNSVHFAKVWEDGTRESKANICKKIGANYLVDDNSEHCNLAAEEGIKALLFGDYGWNRNAKLHPAVTRVRDWQEVLDYFENEQGRQRV